MGSFEGTLQSSLTGSFDGSIRILQWFSGLGLGFPHSWYLESRAPNLAS